MLRCMFLGTPPAEPADDILEHVRQGRWSFLFDNERRFMKLDLVGNGGASPDRHDYAR